MSVKKFSVWNKSVPKYDEFQDAITECVTFSKEKNLNVLELGVGKGGTAVTFLKKFKNAKYYGIDNSIDAVDKCKKVLKKYSNIDIKLDDLSNFKTNEKFDVIIASLSIHHLEKEAKQKLLKNIKHWLSPEGIFVFGDLVKLEDKDMNNKAIQIFNEFRHKVLSKKEMQGVKDHIQNYKHIFNTVEELKCMLKEAGFLSLDLTWAYYRLIIIRAK